MSQDNVRPEVKALTEKADEMLQAIQVLYATVDRAHFDLNMPVSDRIEICERLDSMYTNLKELHTRVLKRIR